VLKLTFQCKKCKYRFENRDKSKKDPPRICPWCNSENTCVTVKTADELIKNVDEMVDV